jgi:hypothetical protein
MRFNLTGNRADIEMIGEVVDIPAAPGEVFALHPNVLSDMKKAPYSVTHVETGFRLGTGATLRSAELNAINRAASVPPEHLAQQLALAKDLRASVRVKYPTK